MAKTVPKRLSDKDFKQAVAHFPRMPNESIKIARLVLVGAKPRTVVAEQFDKTRQAVDKVVNRIYDKHLEVAAGCPKGWVVGEFCLPPALAKEVRDLERKAKAQHGATKVKTQPRSKTAKRK